MKKHLFCWLIMAMACLCISRARAQQTTFTFPGYVSYWNATTQIPDSVVYVAKPHVKVADRLSTFHTSGNMQNQDRDYHNSGYDQGHLCNASDENGSAVDEFASFSQVNIFPQRPNCNRLTWLALENYVRTLAAKYGSVKIKVYWHGIAGYMGVDKITIPQYCDKEIWYGNIHEKYSVPNADTVNRHLFTYYKIKTK